MPALSPRDGKYVVAEVTDDGRVLWGEQDPLNPDGLFMGDTFELTTAQVIQLGLTDQAREAINDFVERQGRPGVPEPQEGISDTTRPAMKAEPPPTGLDVLGGYTDVWRWQRVLDGEQVLVALDNKPQVEAHDPTSGERPPEFQHVIFPLELLDAIRG